MHTYQSTLQASLKINWHVEDLIGPDRALDFSKPFLPEAIAHTEPITCLKVWEKLTLNQIRGNSYLHLFILVEQFIIPMVFDQLKAKGFADIDAVRALLCFAEEEGKHIQLFQAFAQAFQRGFASPCLCIEPETIPQTILRHHPLSVLLLTLHFELMTQSHYLESVRNNQEENLDPRFCSLLKHHWLEEAQHTKLDTLLIQELASHLSPTEIDRAIAEYLALVELLNETFIAQVKLDIQSLAQTLTRTFTPAEYQELHSIQEQAYRWSFLCEGMSHPNFVNVLDRISPQGKAQVTEMAKHWSKSSLAT